jgi:multiple sugar transport system ATP-binding protein
MASIQFESVTKRYGRFTAVDGVDLSVRDQEFMVLVGPSGCGKSTLLRLIAGLEDVTEGSLSIGGKRMNGVPPKDRDIAVVFQHYALYPHMTVYENLAFGLKIRGLGKREIRGKVMEAARILDIEPLLDRKPAAMSGGQRQRVAIGRAIVRQPKVFLFDEPLSNLDAKLRGQMRQEIARLHQQLPTTMVYVTHDQVEAMTLGDRIAVVKEGKIQQVDTPQRLYDHPKNRFVAGFIGAPPMNFIEGRVEHAGGEPCFVDDARQLAVSMRDRPDLASVPGRAMTLGIRPEHLHVRAAAGGDSSASFPADVQMVERLGHESFVFARLGRQAVTARIPSSEAVASGSRITLRMDSRDGRWFDERGEAV